MHQPIWQTPGGRYNSVFGDTQRRRLLQANLYTSCFKLSVRHCPNISLIARFMGPTWGPSGADRTQVGPMLAPWTLLSGTAQRCEHIDDVIFSAIWISRYSHQTNYVRKRSEGRQPILCYCWVRFLGMIMPFVSKAVKDAPSKVSCDNKVVTTLSLVVSQHEILGLGYQWEILKPHQQFIG